MERRGADELKFILDDLRNDRDQSYRRFSQDAGSRL
jgi:hypothetical protein